MFEDGGIVDQTGDRTGGRDCLLCQAVDIGIIAKVGGNYIGVFSGPGKAAAERFCLRSGTAVMDPDRPAIPGECDRDLRPMRFAAPVTSACPLDAPFMT